MGQVPIDTSYFASDLVAVVDDLPATAYFSTLPGFHVSVTQLSTEAALIIVGNDISKAIEATFPVSYLGTAATPVVGDRMALAMPGFAATANYQVVKTALTQDGIGFVITLTDDNRVP